MLRPLQYFISVCFIVIAATAAFADDVKTGPRPGEDEPYSGSQRTVFRDDELFFAFDYDFVNGTLGPSPTILSIRGMTLVPTKSDLTAWKAMHDGIQQFRYSHLWPGHWAAAGGLLTGYPNEQVVFLASELIVENQYHQAMSTIYENGPGFDPTLHEFMNVSETYPFAVITEDLDNVVDEDGHYTDEIVVARTLDSFSDYPSMVLLMDHNLQIIDSVGLSKSAMAVRAGFGDFNGDGQSEIAVALFDRSNIDMYIFEVDPSESPLQLKQKAFFTETMTSPHANGPDFAVGDFNGDGLADMAVATGSELRVYAVTAPADSDWVVARKAATQTASIPDRATVYVRMVSGVFHFEPPEYGLNRRELALFYVITNEKVITCKRYIIEADYNIWYQSPTTAIQRADFTEHLDYFRFPVMDVVAGNFKGHATDTEQTTAIDQIAVAFWYAEFDTSSQSMYLVPKVYVWATDTGNLTPAYVGKKKHLLTDRWPPNYTVYPTYPSVSLAAFDADGDSYILGQPLHIVVDNHLSLDYVIQEPPKHVDYLPVDPKDPDGDWETVNVSANSDFHVLFKDSSKSTIETKLKNQSNWSIGGSASLDVKASISAGDVLGLEKLQLSAESETKVTYKYEEEQEDWDSQYASRELTYTSVTGVDDFILGKFQLLDIWRFPIIGYKNPDSTDVPYAMMDIVVPGPKLTFKSNGLDHADWYQPLHQNKNILSYPLVSNPEFPLDLGSFNRVDGTEVKAPMNPMDVQTYGGNAHSVTIEWTEQAGHGEKKSYSHTLGESEDIKTGVSGKATFPAAKIKGSVDVAIGFENENSIGGTATTQCTNSKSSGITINVPTGHSEQSYFFKSAVYVEAGTGELKVAHAVDPTGSTLGNQWWLNNYGRLPDPALNLPLRMTRSGSDYILNEKNSRMEMRGFFMRKSEPDPVSGEYQILAGPPKDGDTVRLCARVYNFALNNPTGTFNVLFESIRVNPLGDEVGSRETIGTTSADLDAFYGVSGRTYQEVCVPWDTTGRYDPDNGYRFYATVDPNDDVKNELHEWKDADGAKLLHGNNEGYWPWVAGGIPVLKPKDPSASQTDDPGISARVDALSLKTGEGFVTEAPVAVVEGKEYLLRARLEAGGDRDLFHYVVFSEGPPAEGNIISIRQAPFAEGENYVWARWTPEASATYTLYVYVMEHTDDPYSGDAMDELSVTVEAKNEGRTSSSGGCFISTVGVGFADWF